MTRFATIARLAAWNLLASPWLFGLAVAFVVAVGMLHDVARITRRSVEVGRRVDDVRAHLVADTAALNAFATPLTRDHAQALAEWEVEVRHHAEHFTVHCRLPHGRTRTFRGQSLAGAPPAAFARPLSFVAGDALPDGVRIGPGDVPRLDDAAVAAAARVDVSPWFRRDPSIALQHLQAGTDRDDFVFAATGGAADLGKADEVLVVPGNLWLEPGLRPLEVRLRRDTVVVVRGNLHLGRSLRTSGTGRLWLVTAVPGCHTAYVDTDGNGRWAEGEPLLGGARRFAGCIEGAGGVYVGGRTSRAPVELDASLVVAGQLHLFTLLRGHGPVVLGHGLTAFAANARLEATGAWHVHPERERVPGFVTRGQPRPGLLRASDATNGAKAKPASSVRAMGEQPLYLSPSPR